MLLGKEVFGGRFFALGFGGVGLGFLADALVLAKRFFPDCSAELDRVFGGTVFSVVGGGYPAE